MAEFRRSSRRSKRNTFGNGQTASTTFDVRSRPEYLVNGPPDITYAYDQVGNVTSMTDARAGCSVGNDTRSTTSVTGYRVAGITYGAAGNQQTRAHVIGTSRATTAVPRCRLSLIGGDAAEDTLGVGLTGSTGRGARSDWLRAVRALRGRRYQQPGGPRSVRLLRFLRYSVEYPTLAWWAIASARSAGPRKGSKDPVMSTYGTQSRMTSCVAESEATKISSRAAKIAWK